jgi:hypothetical protein
MNGQRLARRWGLSGSIWHPQLKLDPSPSIRHLQLMLDPKSPSTPTQPTRSRRTRTRTSTALPALVASLQASVNLGDCVAIRSSAEWSAELGILRKERREAKPLPAQVGVAKNKVRDYRSAVEKQTAALASAKEDLAGQQKQVALMEGRVDAAKDKLKAAEADLAALDTNCAAGVPPAVDGGVAACCHALLRALPADGDEALIARLHERIESASTQPMDINTDEDVQVAPARAAHNRERGTSRSPRRTSG